MRALVLATLSFPVLVLACQGEEPGGVEASVARATLDVNTMAADSLATLDITVELQARSQPEEVTLGEVRVTVQPVTDSSASVAISASMMNPQGDDPIVRLAEGEAINVRVLNEGTTNAELQPVCGPSELSVTVETGDGEEATTTSNITVRCS